MRDKSTEILSGQMYEAGQQAAGLESRLRRVEDALIEAGLMEPRPEPEALTLADMNIIRENKDGTFPPRSTVAHPELPVVWITRGKMPTITGEYGHEGDTVDVRPEEGWYP